MQLYMQVWECTCIFLASVFSCQTCMYEHLMFVGLAFCMVWRRLFHKWKKKVWYFLLSMSKPKGKPFLCYSLCLSGPEWSTIVNPSQQLWHFVNTFQGNPVKQPNLHIFQKPVEHALREDQLSFMGNVLYGLSICTVLLHCNVSVLLRSWIMHPKIVS